MVNLFGINLVGAKWSGGGASKLSIIPALSLPDPADARKDAIYLVSVPGSKAGNIFDEYIVVDGKWEKFGTGLIEGVVKTVNGSAPDASGNIDVAVMTDEEKAKLTALDLKTGKFSTALGEYDEVGEKSMAVKDVGKAIGTDGKDFAKTGYAISDKIAVNRGDIIVFPSSQVLPTDVSFFNRAVTRTYNKIDHYEYEYDDEGNITKETPVFVEVTESFYEALSAQSVAAMPQTGYVYLCPTTMEIVVCGLENDIRSKKLQVFGFGVFKNMATNFVGAPGQRIIAQMFLQQQAEINALKSMVDNLGALRCRSLTVDDIPMVCGVPMILIGHGVPADGNVPDNWDTSTMGQWNGCPCYIGQKYINVDAASSGEYYANGTDAVSNWKQA